MSWPRSFTARGGISSEEENMERKDLKRMAARGALVVALLGIRTSGRTLEQIAGDGAA